MSVKENSTVYIPVSLYVIVQLKSHTLIVSSSIFVGIINLVKLLYSTGHLFYPIQMTLAPQALGPQPESNV